MNTTLSMWLGITFLILAVAAVLLQAWLWGPKFWNEQEKKTNAPKGWLRVHAACGYLYLIIYVVMMWNMFPRLWEYQYELPARTVIHAVVAIAIGVILLCKIGILLFFRHFEEAMPRYGFALLMCTVVLIVLSVPHAVRGLDLGGRISDPDNIARVDRLLAEIDWQSEVEVDVASLTEPHNLRAGRELLVNKCVTCHDMRTILTKPRTGNRWYEVSMRMLEKPDPFSSRPLLEEDIPYVTAYLIAITPDIQKSRKRKIEQERESAEADAVATEALATMRGEDAGEDAGVDVASLEIDEGKAKAALEQRCTECHELSDVDAHEGTDLDGWTKIIAEMIEEGAELSKDEAELIAGYLAQTKPKPQGT